jgi:adenosylcobinamide amidohydrolase
MSSSELPREALDRFMKRFQDAARFTPSPVPAERPTDSSDALRPDLLTKWKVSFVDIANLGVAAKRVVVENPLTLVVFLLGILGFGCLIAYGKRRANLSEDILKITTLLLLMLLSEPLRAQLAAPPVTAQTTFAEAPGFTANRAGKYLVVELRGPHRVLSTSAGASGQTESVRYLVNHQSMEAAGDMDRHDKLTSMSEEQYHNEVARELGVPPQAMAMMGTAANINYAAHKRLEFRDLRVDVFVTAGVEGNATRAGDPANFFEGDKGWEAVSKSGTINTIVIVNKPLTIAAQTRSIISMVEGKSAALAELAVPSRVTPNLATGTGTDQFIFAAPIDPKVQALRGAGSHTKLGELVGNAVREATKEALRWQNGLEPSSTRIITRALGRFGLTETELLSRLKENLPAKSYDLLVNNQLAVTYEPRVSAAAYAYAAVLDRIQYGTLPESLAGELLRDQAANVAVALSSKASMWPEYWSQIPVNGKDWIEPFVKGLILGWQTRW